MRFLVLLFLTCSCASQRELQPSDTVFDSNRRNWLEVYSYELNQARENNDYEAFRFFWPEYLKELDKTYNK